MSSIPESMLRAIPRAHQPARLASSTIAASSISKALGVIGDRWALRIIGDSFAGLRRFEEFQARSGAARSTLSNRLNCLVHSGVLDRVPYSDRPLRNEYRLSQQGVELYGLTLLCSQWERAWVPGNDASAASAVHKACGHALAPELVCRDCGGPVALQNTHYEVVIAVAPGTRARPHFRRLSPGAADDSCDLSSASLHLTDIIGDRWTLLVISAGFLGLRRFDAMQKTLRIATNILTHRLNRLVGSGLFRRRLYSQHPPRCEYHLTQKGRDLFPVAVMLLQWGDRWLAPPSGGNLRLFHNDCGQRLQAVVACSHCAARIEPDDVSTQLR